MENQFVILDKEETLICLIGLETFFRIHQRMYKIVDSTHVTNGSIFSHSLSFKLDSQSSFNHMYETKWISK